MTIDFEPDELRAAVADSLTALCVQHCPESVSRADPATFPAELWSALADFGLFALGTADGAGGVVEVAAAGEVLGKAAAPGPLGATLFAAHILPEDLRGPVIAGEAIVSVGEPPLMPLAPIATLFIENDGEQAWLLEKAGEVEPVSTLGGEPWGRAEMRRVQDLGSSVRAGAVQDIFTAAYLAGAARKLLRDAAEYVSQRRQFNKTLSQFQAVTQPLAEAAIRARGAATLTLVAAHGMDVDTPDAIASAASARLSAESAAMRAVYVCHQSYGAMGMTVDGPVFYVSRRLRQLANEQAGTWPRLRSIEQGYLAGEQTPLRAALR